MLHAVGVTAAHVSHLDTPTPTTARPGCPGGGAPDLTRDTSYEHFHVLR